MMSGITTYFGSFFGFNRNVRLSFSANLLNGLSQGIFLVVFNLYILEMGISADVLGGILSASPLAQALGSIPIGFLAEVIGFRKVFVLIYGISGLARLAQVSTGSVGLISATAFLGGLALAGDFVVRLSFLAANTTSEERTQVYSLNSLIFSLSMSVGALAAGFMPNLFSALNLDLLTAYRLTLYVSGALAVLAVLPCLRMQDLPPAHDRKISLKPYLWGMDTFTVKQALVSLFVGLSLGMITPFMNLYFIYHLGGTREFFGSVSAVTVLFTMTAVSLAPLLARRWGSVPVVTAIRMVISVFLALFAFTTNPLLGAAAYWMMMSMFQMSQPLSFAFAMRAATEKAKTAASAWLNVTYWLGNAVAAPLVGWSMARSDYTSPLFWAAGAVIMAGLVNQLFFHRMETRLNQQEAAYAVSQTKTG